LREINDKLQGNPAHPSVLPLLREAEGMAKKMSRRLVEYNKKVFAGWWEENRNYAEDVERRLNEDYIS
jgi:hypothetical protein